MANNEQDIKAAFERIIERNKENNWLNPKLVFSKNEFFFRIDIDGFDEIFIPDNKHDNPRIELYSVQKRRKNFRLLFEIIYTK
jgi:hypothetical protein